ncbi:MAG: Crp/Fnr family transcriptional regulator, partial [Sphingomicrobium sp.]
MVRKLSLWGELGQVEREVILAMPHQRRRLDAGQYIVWDGDTPQHSCLLMSGFAYRHKHAGNGGRQILSIHMKGDVLDLQNSLLGVADHDVQMLTAGEIAMIPVDVIRDVAFRYPAIGMAMWYETLVEGSIFREWVLNIGRRDARTRVAHLLCEFAMRLEFAEIGHPHSYELPIT